MEIEVKYFLNNIIGGDKGTNCMVCNSAEDALFYVLQTYKRMAKEKDIEEMNMYMLMQSIYWKC